MKKKLPKELVALIQHIELSKAGWWDKAMKQLIASTIWSEAKSLSSEEILLAIKEIYQFATDGTKIEKYLYELCESKKLICTQDKKYKLTETCKAEFEVNLNEYKKNEEVVISIFNKYIEKYCPELNPKETWEKFNEEFFYPYIRELGATVYHLITGESFKIDRVVFDNFLAKFPKEIRLKLSNAIKGFFNPTVPEIRSFILGELNTCLLAEAGSLSEDDLEALDKITQVNPTFNIFIDTNYIFSMLGLHENPSNEAAISLLKLIDNLKGKATVNLYILPTTIEEVKISLNNSLNAVRGVRVRGNLAAAATESDLSSIARKYFEEAKIQNGSINAAEYFNHYIDNLLNILKGKGVTIFNEKLDKYKTAQPVVDDINMQLERQAKYKKKKSYEQLEHDMILWHFANDKRPATYESPADAVYFVVSIDFKLLGFDAYKQRISTRKIPICLHPSVLIQMLRFWVPRTPEFDEALLSSLRLPFLFKEFDIESEKITIKILEVLGRFENIDDLPKETITGILINDALRQKIVAEPDIEKEIELVKEALIEENEKAKEKISEQNSEIDSLGKHVDEKDSEIQKLQGKVQSQNNEIIEERDKRKELEERFDRIEKESVIIKFKAKWTNLSLIALFIGLTISYLLTTFFNWRFEGSFLIMIYAFITLILIGMNRDAKNNLIMNELGAFSFVRKLMYVFIVSFVLISIIGGIFINNLSERIDLIEMFNVYVRNIPPSKQ